MRRMNYATLVVVLVASFFAAKVAIASVMCCDMNYGSICFYESTNCPPATLNHSYISIAIPPGGLLDKGAKVEQYSNGSAGGLCFSHTATSAGAYMAPDICIPLVPVPGVPMVQVSEGYTPWEGNAFAFEGSASFADWYNALYMSCYAGTAVRDEQGAATHAVGSGYTCGPLRNMTRNTAGVGAGTFHFLPTVNNAPNVGIQPRLAAGYGLHLVGHYDLFRVYTGSPSSPIEWHRTVNGVVKPVVTLGTTDQYGSADVWFPPWTSGDVGTNTLFVIVGTAIFTSSTLTFTVQ